MKMESLLLLVVVAGVSLLSGCARAGSLAVTALRTEYRAEPLGVDTPNPRLSWQVTSPERGQFQSEYQILVASTAEILNSNQGDLWDTGRAASGETLNIAYAGAPLRSRQECFWKVRAWDAQGRPSKWSDPARWAMGLLQESDWKAQWISFRDTSPVHADQHTLYLPPARYYRKGWTASKPVRRATIYASALGIYELHLNGKRVGDARFTPGWSDYRKRVYYDTLDVTGMVQQGANVLGAIVADGWYAGYVGFGVLRGYGVNKTGRYYYGKTPALMAQLEIEYQDGTTETVVTDASWKVSAGPLLEADILMGEVYDARLEKPRWAQPGFDDSGWASAIRARENGSIRATMYEFDKSYQVDIGFIRPAIVQSYPGPPVRITGELPAVGLTEPIPGTYIFDLGQNFAGVVRLKVRGKAGTQIHLRHGEMLKSDGMLMTDNLRKARAADTYVLRGDPNGETWMPRFTYHGFRYVELTGVESKPPLDTVTGIVLGSDTPRVSSFECSDDVVNRIYRNVTWTQRANFFDIPTDCPQRDERLGWTGDAQIYIRAATYNADVAAFFTKWLDDLQEAQLPSGTYPSYAPMPFTSRADPFAIAWSDAGVICPYTIYHVYNDRRVIERHYESMKRFMEFRLLMTPDLKGAAYGADYGDWLSLGAPTPLQYIDATYLGYVTRMMAEMADAIGRSADANGYRDLFARLQKVFLATWVNQDGSLKVDNQTAYALALQAGLFPENLRQQAADRLASKIHASGDRMDTGFLGTKPLLPVLSANGHDDLAVTLLQSRHFPSWGYEVVNGATTIWERWNSYTNDKGFGDPAMNSFDHYAFGAVAEWMFESLAGIDTAEAGYKKILIRPGPPSPQPGVTPKPISWVKASYGSPRGRITSDWNRSTSGLEFKVTIPANTTATVSLPAPSADAVREGGKSIQEAEGIKFQRMEGGRAVMEVGSGYYDFTVR